MRREKKREKYPHKKKRWKSFWRWHKAGGECWLHANELEWEYSQWVKVKEKKLKYTCSVERKELGAKNHKPIELLEIVIADGWFIL